jgi:hypothetical protein
VGSPGAGVTLAIVLAAAVAHGAEPTGPSIAGCPVFPPDSIWNVRVDTLPVHPRSAPYVDAIGRTRTLHPDFGAGLWNGGPIGIPWAVVPAGQAPVAVAFDYADESDPAPYPIPADPPIEGGAWSTGDRHILLVDPARCTLHELYAAYPEPDGSWRAGSGAIFDLASHALRPDGWTSADAAGLAILPGLVRYEEVEAGEIRHAIRFTAPVTQRAHVWPARHHASSNTSPDVPPMGQRFRLKASFDVSAFPPRVRVILTALQRYGMILADNGSSWYLSGAPDPRWDDDELVGWLRQVSGDAFEAVDVSGFMIDPASGQARAGGEPPPPPAPTRTLTVSVRGTGTVTSTPPGIACSAGICEASFPRGTPVTLVAAGGTLRAWGGACSGKRTCRVTLGDDRRVRARFRP